MTKDKYKGIDLQKVIDEIGSAWTKVDDFEIAQRTRFQRISESNKGRIISEESRLKTAAALKGRVVPEETIQNRKEALKVKFDSKTFTYNGVTYPNKKEARRILNIKASTLQYQLRQPADKVRKTKPFTYNGVEYKSIKEASEILNVQPMTLRYRKSVGKDIDG